MKLRYRAAHVLIWCGLPFCAVAWAFDWLSTQVAGKQYWWRDRGQN